MRASPKPPSGFIAHGRKSRLLASQSTSYLLILSFSAARSTQPPVPCCPSDTGQGVLVPDTRVDANTPGAERRVPEDEVDSLVVRRRYHRLAGVDGGASLLRKFGDKAVRSVVAGVEVLAVLTRLLVAAGAVPVRGDKVIPNHTGDCEAACWAERRATLGAPRVVADVREGEAEYEGDVGQELGVVQPVITCDEQRHQPPPGIEGGAGVHASTYQVRQLGVAGRVAV